MKKFILLCFLISFLQSKSQQSVVRGIVSIHNTETETGKRQYVTNAQVEDDFGKAQPRITDNTGQFGLVYVGIAEKAPVSFQIKKQGLQVVNIDALRAVAGQLHAVKISMATPDKIDNYKREIYRIGKSEAEKKLDILVQKKNRELTELKRNTQLNANKIKQLNDELSSAEAQRSKIEEQAQDLARRYAPVNLDDVSPLLRNAFLLFQNGNLDSALLLLQQGNLSEKVDSILLEERKIEGGEKELQVRDSVKAQRKQDIGEALVLKADLHKTNFQFDSATMCFDLLVKLDSSNTEHLFDYALFLAWLNQHDKAIIYYAKALKTFLVNLKLTRKPMSPVWPPRKTTWVFFTGTKMILQKLKPLIWKPSAFISGLPKPTRKPTSPMSP
jgi:hypothetical protein